MFEYKTESDCAKEIGVDKGMTFYSFWIVLCFWGSNLRLLPDDLMYSWKVNRDVCYMSVTDPKLSLAVEVFCRKRSITKSLPAMKSFKEAVLFDFFLFMTVRCF